MNIKLVLNAFFIEIIIHIFSTPAFSASVFPRDIQACINTMACNNLTLIQQEPMFSAYSYFDEGMHKYLFKYSLSSSSNESTNFSTTELSGTAWLSANATYDLSENSHFFTLYLDNVTPAPTNIWIGDSDGLDVGLSVSTTDLLAGSSFFRLGEDISGPGVFLEGDLEAHGFLPCLASTCEIGAELNLLKMQFQQSGSFAELVLNPLDQRRSLYSQYQDYAFDDTFYLSQSYNVIPIPPSVWLFGSGLMGLLGFVRRKKA